MESSPKFVGRYQIVREVARGAMGVVLHARDSRGMDVAVKVLRAAVADEEGRSRFRREVEVTSRLRHPTIVPLIDAGVSPQGPYLVTPLVDGVDLQRRVTQEGPFDPRRAVEVCAAIADALVHAHQEGVLHRDLKPANVLLDSAGRPGLTDFGLASSLLSAERLTQTGDLLGTPHYMAPEQATGQRALFNETTDVYGLGATLYFLLSGEPPFGGTTLEVLEQVAYARPPDVRSVRPEVDEELSELCARCMAKDQGQRYPSAVELRDALRSYLSAPRRAPRSFGRSFALALGACVVLGGALSAYLERGGRESPALVAAPSEPAERLLVAGQAALDARELRRAAALGAFVGRLRPLDPRPAALVGRAEWRLERRSPALRAFRRALELGASLGPSELAPIFSGDLQRFVWATFLSQGPVEECALLAVKIVFEPGIDLERERERLDALGQRARERLRDSVGEERLRGLVTFVFEEGAKGDSVDYGHPRNSCLHCVVERRRGIHLTTCLLLIAVGRRAGVELSGVCFPNQFLARTTGEPPLMVDAFAGEVQTIEALSRAKNRGRPIPTRFLRAATRAEIMVRLLGFVEGNLAKRGRADEQAACQRLLAILSRDDPGILRRAFGG